MKAVILAVSAMMIGLTACNKEAKRETDEAASAAAAKTEEEARQTNRDVQEGAAAATDESRQAARDAKDGVNKEAADARDKMNEGQKSETSAREQGATSTTASEAIGTEARQTGRDIKEGAQAAGSKVKEETRQTSRDISEAVGSDRGVTESDKKLIDRIRTAIKADKDVAKEAGDVRITADNGKVKLTGTVASKDAKKEIEGIAKGIAGAVKVEDDMKVAERVGTGSAD